MDKTRIAALDMGGTKIKACLFENGEAKERIEVDSEAKRGADVFLENAAAALSSLGDFAAVGISTAGQVDPLLGVIRYANDNIPGYTGVDVRAFFENRFSKPAAVINDVYAAALGEGIAGAAKGETDYICLTYGTGIGGGIVLSGRLYYGGGTSAGVMLGGLLTHPEHRRKEDAFSGTYERYASTTALVRAAMAVDPEVTDGKKLFMRLSEPALSAVFEAWLSEVAAGIASLVHVYNPDMVILGGGIMEQPRSIKGVEARMQNLLIPGFAGVKIKAAALGNMAGLYGAYHVAKERLFSGCLS